MRKSRRFSKVSDKPRYYGDLLLMRHFYSKLNSETFYDLKKFFSDYPKKDLLTFDEKINKLVDYYESLEKKRFLVDLEHILIDFMDIYFEWFHLHYRSKVGPSSLLSTGHQIDIMFSRLKELYVALKPIKNDFKVIYDKIEDFRLHRKHRKKKYKKIF